MPFCFNAALSLLSVGHAPVPDRANGVFYRKLGAKSRGSAVYFYWR